MEEKLLVGEYIGKGAEKIADGKYNTVAAVVGMLVGPAWFFYRKMYLIGFLCLAFSFLLGFIFSGVNVGSSLSIIMGAIYGGLANKLYIWHAKRKIKKIIEKNSYLSQEEIIGLIRKKGGTSVLAAVFYGLVMLAYIAFIFMVVFLFAYLGAY